MDVDDRLSLLIGHLVEHSIPCVAGVVDQDVDLAKGCHRGLHQLVGESRVGHTAGNRKRYPTGGANLCNHPIDRHLIAIVDYHLGPFARKMLGRRGANTAPRRNKADKQDSDVIVDFCQAIQPKVWTPPPAEVSQLRAMVRLRATLVKMVTQQQNRLGDCQDKESQACYQRLIDTLKSAIKQVEGRIAAHIAHYPHLQEQADLIDSIQGLGPISTWTIMAAPQRHPPDLATYENAHAAVAAAGVNPAHHESGDTIRRKPKLSKVGKASIRGVLHMPALTAIRHNPVVKALAERLASWGKSKNLMIAAAMRKLIHLVYGVLKNKRPFDPHYGAAPRLAT